MYSSSHDKNNNIAELFFNATVLSLREEYERLAEKHKDLLLNESFWLKEEFQKLEDIICKNIPLASKEIYISSVNEPIFKKLKFNDEFDKSFNLQKHDSQLTSSSNFQMFTCDNAHENCEPLFKKIKFNSESQPAENSEDDPDAIKKSENKRKFGDEEEESIKSIYKELFSNMRVSIESRNILQIKELLDVGISILKLKTNTILVDDLITQACKYKLIELLNYILKQQQDKPNYDTVKVDRIIKKNNLFYFAIRSNDIKILNRLIDQNSNNSFEKAENHQNLDTIISKAYEELQLRNIPLSEDMKIFIENKLTIYRLSYTKSGLQNIDPSFEEIKNIIKRRINFMLENIDTLHTEYSNEEKKVDSKFIHISVFIAKSINLLKKFLKPTEAKILWEQIEFSLIAFISAHTQHQEINLFYNAILSKKIILGYLNYFENVLQNLEIEDKNYKSRKLERNKNGVLQNLQIIIRNLGTENINLLYDYKALKTIYSLERIQYFVKVALMSFENQQQFGHLAVERALQVMGEYLKNTSDSPHLPSDLCEVLLFNFEKNMKTIVSTLRNQLSHLHTPFDLRSQNSENILNIKQDLIKIENALNSINYDLKIKIIELMKIVITKNKNNISTCETLVNTENIKLNYKNFYNEKSKDIKKIRELVNDFKNILKNPTPYENDLFNEIEEILTQQEKKQSINANYGHEILSVLELTDKMNVEHDIENIFLEIQSFAYETVEIRNFNRFEQILMLVQNIFLSANSRLKNQRFKEILFEIFRFIKFEIRKIDGIKELKCKLENNRDQFENFFFVVQQNSETVYNYLQRKREEHEQFENDLLDLENLPSNPSDSEIEKINVKWGKKLETYAKNLNEKTKKRLMSFFKEYDWKNCVEILNSSAGNYRNFMNAINIFIKDGNPAKIFNAIKTCEVEVQIQVKKAIEQIACEQEKKSERDLFTNFEMLKHLFSIEKQPKWQTIQKLMENKVLLAAQEMILFNILNYLEKKKYFVSNHSGILTFLDSYVPTLTGKQLRNYLAHGNPLIDILQANPSVAIVSNALEILESPCNIFQKTEHEIFIGQPLLNLSHFEEHHQNCLNFITNQLNLFSAVQNGSVEIIRNFMNEGADINGRDFYGWNVLHFASAGNNIESFKFLFSNNLVFAENIRGEKPLHIAAEFGSEKILSFCIKERLINITTYLDKNGRTILHHAVKSRQKGTLLTILQNFTLSHSTGFLNLKDAFGITCFHVTMGNFTKCMKKSCCKSDLEITKMLITKGGNPTIKTKLGYTALHFAALNGFKEIIEFFLHAYNVSDFMSDLENGAQEICANNNLWNPLHLAAKNGHSEIVEILIKHKFDVNCKGYKNWTALHLAAGSNHLETIKILLCQETIDINLPNLENSTALHLAAYMGHKNVIEALLNFEKINIFARDGNGCTALHLACQNGQKDIVQLLCDKCLDINTKDNLLWTPLFYAVEDNRIDIISFLLQRKDIDLNNVSRDGYTVLHLAAGNGNKKIVEILLTYTKNKNINYKSSEGCTPLHLAAQNGHKDVVFILCQTNGINTCCVTNKGLTALHLAAINGHEEVVEVLSKEVDVNLKNETVGTALHAAATSGYKEVVKALLKHSNIEINSKFSEGCTPLHLATQNNHQDVVKILLNNENININCANDEGYTPLHIAALHGHTDLVQIFLQRKHKDLNICAESHTRTIPLHTASISGHTAIISFLIDAEISTINHKNAKNITPLMYASINGHEKAVECLLKYKDVDVNIVDDYNYSALHYAVQYGYPNIVKFLLQHSQINISSGSHGNLTPLHLSAKKGDKHITEILLNTGNIDINAKDSEGRTPLHFAVQNNNVDIIEILLKNSDVNICSKNQDGNTALHLAAQFNYEKIVEILFRFNYTDINSKNSEKLTPLHLAAVFGHKNIVLALIRKGCDVNCKGPENYSPLHFAVINQENEIIQMLLSSEKINTNSQCSEGTTPLHMAVESEFEQIVEILLKNKNIDVNFVCNYGSALHLAAQSRNTIIINLLINSENINVNLKNVDGYTPLHVAVENKNLAAVRALLNNEKVDICSTTNEGDTPLHLAVKHSYEDIVIYLLKIRKADINKKNSKGLSLLHIATQNNDKNMIKTLLKEQNIDANCKDCNNCTPLHYAAYNGYDEVVSELLEIKNININVENILGYTPLHLAANLGFSNTIKILSMFKDINVNSKNMCSETALHLASQNNHANSVKNLLQTINIEVNIKNSNGCTALHLAAEEGFENIIEILLENSSIDINTKNCANWTSLHLAVYNGHINAVISLLKGSPDVNFKGFKDWTPLHLAVQVNREDIVHALLEIDTVDINVTDSCMDTPLHLAARHGLKAIVETFLNRINVDINLNNNLNNSPLHLAVINSHVEIVKILVNNIHLNINSVNDDGMAPLHIAAINGQKEIVEVLIKHEKVDVNLKNSEEWSALHLAARNGHVEVISILLLSENIDVNLKGHQDCTPLHLAALNGHHSIIKIFLSKKSINVNCKNFLDWSPLHLAIQSNHKQTARAFLDAAEIIDVNSKGNLKFTPLHIAAYNGFEEITQNLLQFESIEPNSKMIEEYTPLHLASQNGHKHIIEIFLQDQRINFDCIDSEHNTCMHFAALNGHVAIVEILCKTKRIDVNSKNISGLTPFHMAAQNGHTSVIELMLSFKEVNVKSQDTENNTALHWSIQNGHIQTVELLLENKIIEFDTMNCKGLTPLHLSAQYGYKSIAEKLLRERINSNPTDIKGRTPLHLAVQNNHIDVIEILAKANTGPNSKDCDGFTALHVAAETGHRDCLLSLLQIRDIDINCKDSKGNTPLHLAAQNGHAEIVKILCETENIQNNLKNSNNLTPYNLAEQGEYKSAVHILLQFIKINSDCKNVGNHLESEPAAEKKNSKICEISLGMKNIKINERNSNV
ncbi:uncharacterized protein LOC129605233 [Condylostylus longicornis]|uniref:uncharacterized protein LOC129605233 n=1 Tax=Condylostylus longicornis TaxID=2530218 RepID=UPI00244DE6F9|nr:uncharacterized protein LOC129605233 [Condylostylus longicornis]